MKNRLIAMLCCMALLSIAAAAIAGEPPGALSGPLRVSFDVRSTFQDPVPEPAPVTVAISGYYSFKREQWSVTAHSKFDTLWQDILGRKGFNLELQALAGGNAETMLVGGAAMLVIPIHPRIKLGGGLALVKNGSTFEGFFSDWKTIELGASAALFYEVQFKT